MACMPQTKESDRRRCTSEGDPTRAHRLRPAMRIATPTAPSTVVAVRHTRSGPIRSTLLRAVAVCSVPSSAASTG